MVDRSSTSTHILPSQALRYRRVVACLTRLGLSVLLITTSGSGLAAEPSAGAVTTSTNVSTTGLTVPSLWWIQELYAASETYGGKLVERWTAYAGTGNQPGRVDFVVNRQLWSLLDYLDRYAFLHEFGTAAREYGYNVRVLTDRDAELATYTCSFDAIDVSQLRTLQEQQHANPSTSAALTDLLTATRTLPCRVGLVSDGKSSVRGRSNPLGGGAANGSGTAPPSP